MARSLAPLESKLILQLEWEKQPAITIEQTMAILGISNDHARQVLHRLARRRYNAPQVRETALSLLMFQAADVQSAQVAACLAAGG
jgi:Fic family protein